jgi:hypothetical protein
MVIIDSVAGVSGNILTTDTIVVTIINLKIYQTIEIYHFMDISNLGGIGKNMNQN